jgi:hypothetical protein
VAKYGVNRRMFKNVFANRLVLDASDDATPSYAPLYLTPTGAPTNAVEGAIYFDDTAEAPKWYDGSAWQTGASLESAAQAFSGTITATGAIAGPRPVFLTTQILTAAHSGAHCVFSVTTVTTYTLPAAAAGLHFRFSCGATAAGTSDIFRVVCATGDFFIGSYIQSTDGTYTTAAHAANGTTHLAWEGNGSTTGGLAGDWLEVTAVSATQWAAYGFGRATGSEGTPWKTS